MCDEMKINSISNDLKWIFWKIAMKNSNNWEKIIELKKKIFVLNVLQYN